MRTLNDEMMKKVSGAGTIADLGGILGSRFGVPGALGGYVFGRHIENQVNMTRQELNDRANDIQNRVRNGEYVAD